MSKRKFRNAYDTPPRVQLDTACGGPSKTVQAEKEACDINNVVDAYMRTGVISRGNPAEGRYMDLPSEVDYQSHLNTVIAVQSAFEQLPAKVRKRFNNAPTEFLEFLSNPDTVDEQVALGLRRVREELAEAVSESAAQVAAGPAAAIE